MPLIIRQALAERIRLMPSMQAFLRDFAVATGIQVEFVGPLGHRAEAPHRAPLCAAVQGRPGGCAMCAKTVQGLLANASKESSGVCCEAGLREVAVPLRAGGQALGFLLFGGHRDTSAVKPLNLARKRTSQAKPCLTEVPEISPEREAALCRLLELGASHLVLAITDNLATPERQLPPLVKSACQIVKKQFTHEVSLTDVSKTLKVSMEHLCRIFHHSTGLHFREYLARIRAEHARGLLLSADRRISEIAFASGFQSLSQFNRRFKAIYGLSPLAYRQRSLAAEVRDAWARS